MNRQELLEKSIDKLGGEFSSLDLTFHEMKNAKPGDLTSYWPGGENEDVLVCVFKGNKITEPFHRQDFFFINYAYKNSYGALSKKSGNLITINENEYYIGQPYSGYALRAGGKEEVVIIGVLIKKDTFFRDYLPTVYTDSRLFRFFIEPRTEKFSQEFILLESGGSGAVKTILEMMVIEYAGRRDDTQNILKSMLQTLILEIAREYGENRNAPSASSTVGQILDYIDNHSDAVTLNEIAYRFGYHPNYISSLLHKTTGKKFTEIILEKRMERAAMLLKNTNLSIEEISSMLGYGDHSNFYKAFKKYYGVTPRKSQNILHS